MSTCAYLTKTLILAFFAINAWNRFSAAPQETDKFKRNLQALETSFKLRVYPAYAHQLSNLILPHSHLIVYYGSLLQLVLSVIGIFCSFTSILVGIIYFKFQFVALNFFKIHFSDLKDLEKYALTVSLFIVAIALGTCCPKSCSDNSKCPLKRTGDRSEQSKQKKH